jgi:hypothetical protein
MAGNGAGQGASVTSRALALLGAFDGGHRSLTLSQLSERAGLPLATAHRLAAELVAWGALERLPSGEYVVGRRMWDLGLLARFSRACANTPRHSCRTCTGPPWPPSTWPSATAVRLSTLTGFPGARQYPWSATPEPDCRCMPRRSAECCSPTRRALSRPAS